MRGAIADAKQVEIGFAVVRNTSSRAWVLPVLVIEPWLRRCPLESSLGISPTKQPMLLPVNRCQSPISTASANAANVARASSRVGARPG
jgi:hypothetical protein